MKRIFVLGPILFVAVVIVLTFLDYDFLLSLGWNPLTAVTVDWPSGLALGRYGLWMTVAFILSGLLILLFALRLHMDLPPGAASQLGSILLAAAGIAMAGLAFATDPTFRTTPATWHGVLHKASYVLLGVSLSISMLFLGKAFRNDPRWRDLANYTWITVAIAIPAFFLKGFGFYIFLVLFLAWNEIVAIRYSSHVE